MGIKNRMKAWSTAAMCGLAVCIGAPAEAAIQDDLVGLWQMDHASGTTAVDGTGNGHDGLLVGAEAQINWIPGIIGNSVELPGGNDTPHFATNTLTEFSGADSMTVSAWIQPDANADFDGILLTRNATTSLGSGANPSNGNWGINHEGNSIDARIQTNPTGSSGLNTAGGSIVNNAWTHVTMTWDNATGARNIYLNGVSVASDSVAAGTTFTDGGSWLIGEDNCCGNRIFNGQIDDGGIWNRHLSSGEVKAIYDRGQESISAEYAFSTIDEGIQQGMVAHWSFDQAAFSTVAYDSKNNNDLNVNNVTHATAWVDGAINGALDMPGTGSPSSHVRGATDLGDGATALTLSIWVNADSTSDWDGFITSTGDFFGLQIDDSSTTAPKTPGHDVHFRAMGQALYTDEAIQVGEWVHYVGVWESGTTFDLYQDGELIGSAAAPVGVADITEWYIGRDRTIGGREFDGQLDDAAIWTRALSAGEILSLYNSGNAGLNAQQAIPTPAAGVAGLVMLGLIGSRRRSRA